MMKWLFYTIPENKQLHYLICMWLVLYIIPEFVLSLAFTVLAQFINFICYDILYYYFLKNGHFDR
jgi:hypothetical protein